MKNNVVAGLIALFIGGAIGIHWFYLGRTGRGIAYLLASIFVIGLPFTIIASFIEGINLLVMDEKVFNYKYNNKELI
jgi:TM2 domain-containing membrane protein YozV